MASSRRSSRAEAPSRSAAGAIAKARSAAAVSAGVERALARHVPAASKMAVALSGGRDSVALFDAALDCAAAHALTVIAVHIHHGLSPHADAWARFCADLCDARSVSLCERRVIVPRGPRRSVEAEARRVRYAA